MAIELLKDKSSRRRDLALDAMASMVMLADANLHIRYLNPSLRSLLRNAEADLKRELPAFAVDKLIGSNIDIFHKAPSHQRNMLAKLTAPHNATIHVGEHVFDLLVAPLRSKGKLSGYVVEWKDARDRLANLEFTAQMSAIGSQAIIEFKPDGTILTANPNFLRVMGYELGEVVGKHHSMFVDSGFAASTEYADFWRRLREGESQSDEFKRIAKGGGVVWVQGSYNPIRNLDGKVSKVVKYVMDVTARRVAVEEIGAALRDLADGKLSRRITAAVPHELESIRHDLNRAAETLGGAIERVGETSRTIAVGLDEINVASADLSQRTEQQAATLEQTVASLSEVMQGVNSTAAEARTASTAASSAMRCAEQGVAVVTEAIGAMSEIEQSSNRIGNIIGVIDEIAFQTNLLALNAGVEAARAGEAGRGFAVVAQEVRGLAQRSAEAAKEIKGLIATSSGQVERGVKLAVASGKSLEEIVAGVAEMKGMAERIAKSATEQATGLREVTIAADQMDKITQQNAAMVEEATAAAQSLQQETENMSAMMARFDVGAPVAARTKPVAKRRPQPPLPAQRRTPGRTALAAMPADERQNESWNEF